MPAQDLLKKVKLRRKVVWGSFLTIVLIIVPCLVMVGSFVYFMFLDSTEEEGTVLSTHAEVKGLKPSKLLSRKYFYQNQTLSLVGKVFQPDLVCQKLDCPQDDTCCGCPKTRNLAVTDAGESFFKNSVEVLKLVDEEGNPLCRRQPKSCDYDCGDWLVKGVYEMDGFFYARSAPKGSSWRPFTEFYFIVDEKFLVKKSDLKESALGVVEKVADFWEDRKKSGVYILD